MRMTTILYDEIYRMMQKYVNGTTIAVYKYRNNTGTIIPVYINV